MPCGPAPYRLLRPNSTDARIYCRGRSLLASLHTELSDPSQPHGARAVGADSQTRPRRNGRNLREGRFNWRFKYLEPGQVELPQWLIKAALPLSGTVLAACSCGNHEAEEVAWALQIS